VHLSVPRLQLYMQLYLLVLALMGLEFVDADVRAAGRLLLAAREGRALALQQWLSLPVWPGYSDESGTRLGIASVGTAPVMLASRAGHLEAALHAALPARARAHVAGVCGCRCSCSRAASTCGSRGQSSCFAAVVELSDGAGLQ
jgi:hypothetical protein